MDHFDKLHPLIKFTIAIPIIILILAIFIQTSRTDRGTSNTQSITIPSKDAQEYGSQVNVELLTDSFLSGGGDGFDLEKPQVCSYSDEDITVEAQIQNKHVFANINQNNQASSFLVSEDCIYQWADGELTGIKMCNIGQYISMFEMFSSFMSPSSLLSSIPGLDSSLPISTDVLSGISDSCKSSIVDEKLFKVPTSITFQEKNIEDLQQEEE